MARLKPERPRRSKTGRQAGTHGENTSMLVRLLNPRWMIGVLGIGLSALAFVFPAWGVAQDKSSSPRRSSERRVGKSVAVDRSLADQLRELQSKVLKLEAALKKGYRGGPPGMSKKKGMSAKKMRGKKMMSRSGTTGRKGTKQMPKMGKRAPGKTGMAAGMGMKPGKSLMGRRGMRMMGRMGGGGPMQMPSALPGFPGASHIYHIGSTSFFLDHDDHITLSQDQRTKLNQIKEQSLLKQATFDRQIEEAEQELWKLTASDKPDIVKIDAQVRKIGTLQGDQRIAFIRAVGESAKLLTDEQRKTLIGTLSAGHKPEGSNPSKKKAIQTKG